MEWSGEDACFVGSGPGLVYRGCRGADEKEVFGRLCQIVDEIIDLYHEEGKARPIVNCRP